MADLHAICQRLLLVIPPPFKPPPKAAKTWHRLKVSDELRLLVSYRLPTQQLNAGDRVRVAKVDTGGVTLVGPPTWAWEWYYTDLGWEAVFERVAKVRKRKAKVSVDSSTQGEVS